MPCRTFLSSARMDSSSRWKSAKWARASIVAGVAVGDLQGLFHIRPLVESDAFPEVGFYREAEEVREYGNDELLLRRVAELTGGRFNPQPRELFDPGGRTIPSTMRLWPGLLGLAILLNLVELIVRKWRGVVETLHKA